MWAIIWPRCCFYFHRCEEDLKRRAAEAAEAKRREQEKAEADQREAERMAAAARLAEAAAKAKRDEEAGRYYMINKVRSFALRLSAALAVSRALRLVPPSPPRPAVPMSSALAARDESPALGSTIRSDSAAAGGSVPPSRRSPSATTLQEKGGLQYEYLPWFDAYEDPEDAAEAYYREEALRPRKPPQLPPRPPEVPLQGAQLRVYGGVPGVDMTAFL